MRRVEVDHKAKIAWVKNGDIALASFAFEAWGGANKAQMAAESYLAEADESPWELRNRIEALEAQVRAADALAEALAPFATSLERYSGFTEYALFGLWEDVNGAAGRKLNILRKANFDDARVALAAYRATKEGGA